MGLRVLLVDEDAGAAASCAVEIAEGGHEVVRATGLAAASEVLMREPIDSIVCSDALRAEVEQAYAAVLPVIPAVGAVAKMLARLTKRSVSPTVQLSLAAQLDAALADATLAFEPIVDLRDGSVRARRGTMLAPSLTETQMIAIASELGRMLELRRAVRRLAADAALRGGAPIAIDCTIEDLLDAQLYASARTEHASATMLVVAERDVLVLAEADARHRLRSLRAAGFTLVSRIGTDIAGLTSVGVVEPSYALIDLAAFGDAGPVLTRVVASIVAACREARVDVIAEVPTPEHAACARETGCALAVGRGVRS